MALEIPVINLEYKRGDSKPIVFVLKAGGVAVDLSGYSLPVMSVHTTKDPVDVTTELFKISGTIPIPANGKVQFIPAINDRVIPPTKRPIFHSEYFVVVFLFIGFVRRD